MNSLMKAYEIEKHGLQSYAIFYSFGKKIIWSDWNWKSH